MTIVIVIFGQVSSRRHALARLTSLLWIERSSRLPDDKARIVEETLAPGATVSEVATGNGRPASCGPVRTPSMNQRRSGAQPFKEIGDRHIQRLGQLPEA